MRAGYGDRKRVPQRDEANVAARKGQDREETHRNRKNYTEESVHELLFPGEAEAVQPLIL
jgi:hypothetical protein